MSDGDVTATLLDCMDLVPVAASYKDGIDEDVYKRQSLYMTRRTVP